jgi:hypothetical protein
MIRHGPVMGKPASAVVHKRRYGAGSVGLYQTASRAPGDDGRSGRSSLNSHDRLFPRQDTLPQGGFGSLIALPLQKEPRTRGNSVFLDADLNPWPDQWAFLASLQS